MQSTRSILYWSNKSVRGRRVITWSIIPLLILLVIYDTAIATLSLSHMVPSGILTCGLDRTWDHLFRTKDGAAIRRIQDAHQCCGLHSIRDRAWPFQSRDHGVDSCARDFNRTRACLESWSRDQQITAGLLLLVALVTFLSKVSEYLPLRSLPHCRPFLS